MTIIRRASRPFPLLMVIALGTAGPFATDSYGQAAYDPGADPLAAGANNNANNPLEESLLGEPQPYGKAYDPQTISNAAQQSALIDSENIKNATPTDNVLKNQAKGNARPQSFVPAGSVALPNDPPIKGAGQIEARTPDAAANNVYRSTPDGQQPGKPARPAPVDPYATTGKPIYKSPW